MYERFVQLLQENNVTTYKVAKETGIGQSSFSDWKTGRATPKTDKLQKVADYFNVSLDYLTGNSEFRTKEEMFAHWEEKHNPDSKLAEEVKQIEEHELVYLARKGDIEFTEEEKQEIIDFFEFKFNKKNKE